MPTFKMNYPLDAPQAAPLPVLMGWRGTGRRWARGVGELGKPLTDWARRLVGAEDGLSVANSEAERRSYPRIAAPVYSRPARMRLTPLPIRDLSFGGMRVYSDEASAVGQLLEVDVLLPDEGTETCLVQVAWLTPLGEDAPAKYDVGLRFVSIPPGFLHQLPKLIEK